MSVTNSRLEGRGRFVSWTGGRRPTRAVVAVLLAVISVLGITVSSIKGITRSVPGTLVPRLDEIIWKGPATIGASANSPAQVQFELKNEGSTSVRILTVESGCGCARPTVRPDVVPPWGSAVVEVTATSVPVGEKVVRLVVRTDSTVNPSLPLTLRIFGNRKPPFLHVLQGEAAFLGKFSPELRSEVTVFTVENGEQRASPKVETNIPFLKTSLSKVEDKPYLEPGSILRSWKYRVEFIRRPPSSSFQGVLTATSPWDPDDSLSLNIVGQLQFGLKAYPSTVCLDRSGREQTGLLIVCGSPGARLDFGHNSSSRIPLTVKEEKEEDEGKTHRVNISLERSIPADVTESEIQITVSERGTSDRLIIPVRFTDVR